ncbi:MAG TPA: SDR family NAD(P)-dependent oxidoreductase [Pirellulales bacterium]|nr:SDR family NAD(P)-dependent oxidoreductase [Pirellulales bacterium]
MARRNLAGSRILITGASSGIGWALALELARAGAKLLLCARRAERLEALASEIRDLGGQAEIAVGDVTNADLRRAALAVAQDRFGGLDILVNNAGISAHGPFDQAGPERLRKIMEVNFFALAEMTREALPLLRQGRQPLVVNVGSILGHRGIPFQSEYCASKFAVRGLSESLRAELTKYGIDLLVVSPGTTDTEFFDHLLEKQGEMPWPEQPGVPASFVAQRTVRAMRLGRHEIVPNFRGRLLVYLNRFAPWLVDRWMEKYGRQA